MALNTINVALVGNPNTGKTSIFNLLTGLKQKVGNYPGITVDKKQGFFKISESETVKVTDLPGTYSINPHTLDEQIVLDTLLNEEGDSYPDAILVIAEVENLKRNLLLFSQIKDLEIPTMLVINMSDQLKRKGISIDIECLEKELKSEVVLVSSRTKEGIDEIKHKLLHYKTWNVEPLLKISDRIDATYFSRLGENFKDFSLYKTWLLISQKQDFDFLTESQKEQLTMQQMDSESKKKYQHKETIFRYQYINHLLKKCYVKDIAKATDLRAKIDRVLTHKFWGYIIFATILLLIFQSIFEWASFPMDLIDNVFAKLSNLVKYNLPKGS